MFFFLLVFLIAGCATTNIPTMTPLEIQSMQTREYAESADVVFPSVISVFQDLGYTIKSADKNTGIITAESASKSDKASKFWLGITKVSHNNATAFVERIKDKTSVRLSFVMSNKQSSWYGQTDQDDQQILDAAVYNNAFEKIANAIFVRTSK
jgi:hypothetical protein